MAIGRKDYEERKETWISRYEEREREAAQEAAADGQRREGSKAAY
jgi:hypothetical protein